MAITKKIRFEVFKRDGFQCAYCGKSPPNVALEIDHIEPKSKGGLDNLENLLTACFDCNRGKKNIALSKAPAQLSENLEVLKEREKQLHEYRKYVAKIELRIEKDIQEVSDIYSEQYENWDFSDNFKMVSLRKFLSLLPKHEIIEALTVAIGKFSTDQENVIKYFCGVCWNKIREKSDPNYEIKKQLIVLWQQQPRGSGYLKKGILDKWLKTYSFDQISEAMNTARGIWNKLFDILEYGDWSL